jgi:hypothetical protein
MASWSISMFSESFSLRRGENFLNIELDFALGVGGSCDRNELTWM